MNKLNTSLPGLLLIVITSLPAVTTAQPPAKKTAAQSGQGMNTDHRQDMQTIHALFDGVVMAAGLLTELRLGLVLFIAVFLHKIPEGITIASIMISAGRDRRAAWRATILIAGATLVGILSVTIIEPAIRYALPFSAGVTLYVAASDLIPEVNREFEDQVDRPSIPSSLFVFVGVILFYLTHLLLTEALGHI